MNAQRYVSKAYNAASTANATFLMERTAALLAAYVSRNSVPPSDLPRAIAEIHAALWALHSGTDRLPAPDMPTSSAIATSIRHDRLVSFVDGKAYKSLKRHLAAHGMTPGDYRNRYGLPSDYPMVSPSYAKLRSSIARQTRAGLKVA